MLPMIDVDRPHPYPQRVTEFSKNFWEALAEGRFMTTASVRTGRPTFPPKPISPADWTDEITWVELSGRGTLYSHTTVHAAPTAFTDDLPYRIGIIDLDEGVRLATRLLGDGEATIDGRVELVVVRYTDHLSFGARMAGQ